MTTETHIDAAFSLTGELLPLDHGYALFSVLSSLVPALHAVGGVLGETQGSPRGAWAIHPVRGVRVGPGLLHLDRWSLLKIRLPASRIADLLPLVGKTVNLEGHSLAIGVPRIFQLEARAALRARFVTVKNHMEEPEPFALAVQQQLAQLPGLNMDAARIRLAVGTRRVMRISGKLVVGFAVAVDGLEAGASIALQVHGVGGRRHMGAGVFVPWGRRT